MLAEKSYGSMVQPLNFVFTNMSQYTVYVYNLFLVYLVLHLIVIRVTGDYNTTYTRS